MMEERRPPAHNSSDAADGKPDGDLEQLLAPYPDLDILEPYCIIWELIWPM